VLWFQIRIDFGRLDPYQHLESGSGSRRANMTHKNKKVKKFPDVPEVLF
jgi:hypothetical protein